MKINSIPCNLCGSKSNKKIHATDGFTLVRCNTCSLVYVNPQPTATEINRFYNESKYYSGDSINQERDSAPNHDHMQTANELKVRLKGGSVLDVGCGSGRILSLLKEKSYLLFGTDYSRELIVLAAHRVPHAKFFVGDLMDAKYASHTFDAVIMSQVLEHTADPMKYIKEISRILKPGGLFLLSVPNQNYFLRKSYYQRLDNNLHLFNFSQKNLVEYLEKTGFHGIEQVHFRILGPRSEKQMYQFAMEIGHIFSRIFFALTKKNVGLLLFVIARKS